MLSNSIESSRPSNPSKSKSGSSSFQRIKTWFAPLCILNQLSNENSNNNANKNNHQQNSDQITMQSVSSILNNISSSISSRIRRNAHYIEQRLSGYTGRQEPFSAPRNYTNQDDNQEMSETESIRSRNFEEFTNDISGNLFPLKLNKFLFNFCYNFNS